MKKNTVLYAALAGLLLSTGAAFAQQGMGTNNPHASSVLDMQSSERGLLIPRVKLEATNLATPVSSPANSLLVYNTETKGAGATAVKPGYYYWDVNKWQRVVNVEDVTTIVGNATDNDTKVTSFTIDNSNGLKLTFTDGTNKSVSITDLKAAIDTNTTYSGSNSVVLSGTTFKRAALTGDVSASEDSNEVTVTKIQGKSVATTAPSSGQVLKWNGSAWAPATLADASSKVTAATLTGNTLKLTQDGGAPEVTVDLSSLATDNDTKVTGFEINSTDGLKITLSDGSTKKIPLATLKSLIDTDTTYTGSTSIKLNGTSFEREALTGDVTAALNSNTVKVTKIQGKEVASDSPSAGDVLQWKNGKWTPVAPALTAEVDGVIGNEVTDATTDKGLVRSGSGTASSPYTLGLVNGTADGQVMKWNNATQKWAPAADADTSSKVTSGTVSGNSLTLQQDGGASAVVIDVSTLATDIKLSSASFDNSSNVLTLTKSDNNTVTVDLSSLATDTNTQSRETVSAGTGITVTPSGTGTDNKNFEVAITPAGASENKILASENGTVKWIDKPTTSSYVGPNFGNGEIRSVNQITTTEWDNNQFALIQTGPDAMSLPPANAANKNRIIAVHNDTAGTLNYAGGAGANRNSKVQSGKGQLLMCDGTKWVVIGGL